jgi:hypothetical protein
MVSSTSVLVGILLVSIAQAQIYPARVNPSISTPTATEDEDSLPPYCIPVFVCVFVIMLYWLVIAYRKAAFSPLPYRPPASSRPRARNSPASSPEPASTKDKKASPDTGASTFDDNFFKFCGCCLPICFRGVDKEDIFRERQTEELRNKKLELHLDGKVVVNGPSNYWGDTLYYIFQKDHFLSIFYCDSEHPFTKLERLKVYWGMVAAAAIMATAIRPPQDCAGYIDPESEQYPSMHTWGRIDCGWTMVCESDFMSPPNSKSMAIMAAAIIKVTYGMFLEYIAFCPCFVDFVGKFKERTEVAGAYVLNFACLMGCYQWYYAIRVIVYSPFKVDMCIAIVTTIFTGIFTGWITYFIMAHGYRVKETGCRSSCQKCAQGADTDGDGVECREVCVACTSAFHEQKDTSWVEAPEGGGSNMPSLPSMAARPAHTGPSAPTALSMMGDGSTL